ncbi:MAG TPA: LPS export ABC transporter periplasmic protein LptC [Coxiellaceae bacterium]|nr:LPS export ABC transporter periplasmic protein LptC [Coxiellaceae bacterium]
MIRFYSSTWLTLTLILITALSTMFMLTTHIDSQERERNKHPNAFMSKLQYTQYDKQGNLQQFMRADEATHYEKNNRTHFNNLYIQFFDSRHQSWQVTAAEGIASEGNKKIQLRGHVIVERLKIAKGDPMTIKTDEMWVYPETHLAETSQPVIVIRPDSVTHARGAIANLSTGEIKFLSDTQVTYTPTS